MVLGISDRYSDILHCHDQRAAEHAVVLVAPLRSHHSTLRTIHSQPHQVLQVHIQNMRIAQMSHDCSIMMY